MIICAAEPMSVVAVIFIALSVLTLVPTILMRVINNNFTRRDFIKLNKTHRLVAKRIENRIVCFELYQNNILIDYAEEVNSIVFTHYVACRGGYYVFKQLRNTCDYYGIDRLPDDLKSKFLKR